MSRTIQSPTRARRERSGPLATPNRRHDDATSSRRGDPCLPQCLADAVDTAVAESFARIVTADPLIPETIAAIRGPLDSVVRRHGLLIESAIAVALEQSGVVEVMVQVPVPVSEAAIQLCQANPADRTADLTMPVGSSVVRTPLLDIVAYYPASGRLVVASVKRGGGAQGGTAARQDRVELRAAAMILRGMLRNAGRPVSSVETVVLDYYGRSGIAAGAVVTGAELDGYFGVPVAGLVEAMTARMAAAVEQRTDERVATLKSRSRPGAPTASTDRRDDSADVVRAFPAGRGVPPTLAECLASLPPRDRGRRMTAVRPSVAAAAEEPTAR